VRRLVHVAAFSAAWFGLWLLLVEKLTPDELGVGAFCALLAGAATEVVWGEHLASFAAKPRMFAQVWRLPWIALSDTWAIFVVLALHLFTREKASSQLRTVRFDPGRDDPHAGARRALAIALTTMTPQFVVIGIDDEEGTMLYHQIRKGEVPEMTRRLGAQP
jgi:multisubunit Na+/H+ antiporter MnhE subunit